MHFTAYFTLLLAATASAQNIIQSNDDGWAVGHIRAFNTALRSSGFSVVLSAPAENRSGAGSSDAPPTPLGADGCQFNSCPPNSPATGFNASDRTLNYVNSFPVTSMRFGLDTLSPNFFNGLPDLAVTGPNVGNNLGFISLISGTVGAATAAANQGVPAIAFSGTSGSQVSFETLSTPSDSTTASTFYAILSTFVTRTILDSGSPLLPPGVILNVNYPSIRRCPSLFDFQFVLTRVNLASNNTPNDVETCGSNRLPSETAVIGLSRCFSSISVMNATTKRDVDADTQRIVLDKLSPILSCLTQS